MKSLGKLIFSHATLYIFLNWKLFKKKSEIALHCRFTILSIDITLDFEIRIFEKFKISQS